MMPDKDLAKGSTTERADYHRRRSFVLGARNDAIRALARRPFDGGILDGLRLGIGPQLRSELEHCVVALEVIDRGMAEAILILMRVELPIGERLLLGRNGKGPDLGDMVAEAHRALAEIFLNQWVAEGVAIEVQLWAWTRADDV